jgi:hypothetical protein
VAQSQPIKQSYPYPTAQCRICPVTQSHKFKVGQSVDIVGQQRLASSPLGKFEIVRLMPTEHGRHQYRVRSRLDGHERMVAESELEGQPKL